MTATMYHLYVRMARLVVCNVSYYALLHWSLYALGSYATESFVSAGSSGVVYSVLEIVMLACSTVVRSSSSSNLASSLHLTQAAI
jgi:hypothetical protein